MAADLFSRQNKRPVVLDLAGFTIAPPAELPRRAGSLFEEIATARTLLQRGEIDASIAGTIRLLDKAEITNQPALRAAVRGLEGSAKMARGDADGGEAALLRALADAQSSGSLESPLGVSLLNNLSALTFHCHNRPSPAEGLLQQALHIMGDPRADHLNQRPVCFRNLGVVLDAQGRHNAAARSFEVALKETKAGPLGFLEIIEVFAANREFANDERAVEELRATAFERMRRTRLESPEAFIIAARELAMVLLKKGDLLRLGSIAREQITAMDPVLGPSERWRLVPPVIFSALHHASEGDWSKAHVMIDWALQLERTAPTEFAGATELLRNITMHYRQNGLTVEANVAKDVYRSVVSKKRR